MLLYSGSFLWGLIFMNLCSRKNVNEIYVHVLDTSIFEPSKTTLYIWTIHLNIFQNIFCTIMCTCNVHTCMMLSFKILYSCVYILHVHDHMYDSF